MNIKDIFELARIETGAESNDISDETLLAILNENLREFISILQNKKSDEFFAVSILNDLIPEQYKYGKLQYQDTEGRTIHIRKILKVRIDGKNIPRVDVLEIDEKNFGQNCYGVSGEELFVYHDKKEVVIDGVEVIGLLELPEVTLNTPIDKIFLGKITTETRILKMGLKSFLYERVGNLNASSFARQEYLKEMKNYINRLGRVKEPIEREIPNLSYFS
ncbi:hypothetical protein DLH72_05065 [Candidatus Gracilibacteria bacterium]|nr:MAG: hypothetical protein DLH72_05065 [Candidatus Gracilibacteria bacterium]